MKYSYTALALAALSIGQVAAGTMKHQHLHAKKTAVSEP